MSEQAKHTPGEWCIDDTNPECVAVLVSGVYEYICDTATTEFSCTVRSEAEERANAARIVACINSMAGLTNEQVSTLRASHAELVDALEHAVLAMRHPLDGWKGDVERAALDLANGALAAAKEL